MRCRKSHLNCPKLVRFSLSQHPAISIMNKWNLFQLTEAESAEYEYVENKEHEAGYDSYMTGVCFIALALELHVKSDELNFKSHQLRNFLNKYAQMLPSPIQPRILLFIEQFDFVAEYS